MENTFLINDGQHRKAAIEEALKDDRKVDKREGYSLTKNDFKNLL